MPRNFLAPQSQNAFNDMGFAPPQEFVMRPDKEYGDLSYKEPRQMLNVPELIKRGAIRITFGGDGKGGFVESDDPEDFSLITEVNKRKSSDYDKWPDKPQAYEAAARMINSPIDPKTGHLVYDGKYRQILDSAKMLGLPDELIYLK
jgi:hypothetical protein